MKKIDIIIPTKNRSESLLKCLNHLNKSFDNEFTVSVIIVDDNSKKAERETILKNTKEFNLFKNFEFIHVIMNGKPVGFSKAVNIGINSIRNKREKYKTEYIGILHDDVLVREGWIKSLCEEIKDDVVGVCSASSNEYDKMPEDHIGLYAAIFNRDEILDLDANTFSSINAEEILYQKYSKQNKKLKVVNSSVVEHQCKSVNTLENFENLKNTSENILKIKDVFDSNLKNVIYTFVGPENDLPNFSNFDPAYEYICFTNNQHLINKENEIWKIVDVSEFYKGLNVSQFNILIKEFFKLHPHLFFDDKELSIWIDSSKIKDIKVKNLSELTNANRSKNYLVGSQFELFNCSYKFLLYLFRQNAISKQEFDYVLELFKWHKYPMENGLIDTSILIRYHNNSKCVNAMNRTWIHVKKYSYNSELFLNLIMWLNKDIYSFIPKHILKNKFLEFN